MNKKIIPKTEIGRKLLEARRKAIAEGMKLMSADEINRKLNRTI